MTMINFADIHHDSLGDIYRVLLPGNRELMLFFCKAGYLRGGHSHDCDEMVILLSGRMRYHKWVNGEDQVTDLNPGEVSWNPAGWPHMGEFLEDSWVVDWKLGGVPAGGFVTTDFEPYRKLVRERMDNA